MTRNRGLPRLTGGLAKREREAWDQSCPLCGGPAAGLIHTLRGPKPVCAAHIPDARRHGYTVWTTAEEERTAGRETASHD